MASVSDKYNIYEYRGSFDTGTGTPKYSLDGKPKIDEKSHQLDLTCNSDASDGEIGKGFAGATGQKRTEALEPLTPQEIDILNRRLRTGDIKLFQPPPIYKRFDMYELPDGKILTLAYDRSDAIENKNRAYLFDPQTETWKEYGAKYHAPDAPHAQMGAGWKTDIGFLQYPPGISVVGALWYEKQGNNFVNPKPTKYISHENTLYNRTMNSLLRSPISNGLKTNVHNPCATPALS